MNRIGNPTAVFVAAILPLLAATAHAQDTGKIGITAQYPASIGVLWQVSNTIALRPDVTFSGATTGIAGSSANTSGWNVGAEFGVLFYLKRYEHVRTYVAPRLDYGYSRSSVSGPTSISISDSRWAIGATGLFGAEYAPVTRFTVFAEIGFGYSHLTLPTGVPSTLSGSGNSWGTRAAVGAVFYP